MACQSICIDTVRESVGIVCELVGLNLIDRQIDLQWVRALKVLMHLDLMALCAP